MKEITVKLYEHSDLILPENRKVLDAVISRWDRDSGLEIELEEIKQDIRIFCEEFILRIHLDYDDIRDEDDPDLMTHLTGNRLRTYLINNRPLTMPKSYYTRKGKRRASKIIRVTNNVGGSYFAEELVEEYTKQLRSTELTMNSITKAISNLITRKFHETRDLVNSEAYVLDQILHMDYNFNEEGEMING